MRIVIDARESGSSTGRYVDKLVEYLHELKPGFEITILTKAHRVEFMEMIAPGFKIVESNYKEFTFAEQLGLLGQISKLKPDLVHFTMTQQPVLFRGRVVTTMHDLTTARFTNPVKNRVLFKIKQVIYRWVIRLVAKKSKKVIVPTEYVKQDLVNYAHIKADKVEVNYEAADKITVKPVPVGGLKSREFIMYLGRPLPHKNLGRLLEAYKLISEMHPDLKLVLAGRKDKLYERYEQEIRQDNIRNVVFPGFVSEGQLRWLYENCAAYVFPSLSEGFGLPGLEAMAHGAPVVSSQATSLPEIYGDAAIYFDPRNVDDMAAKISSVLDNKKLAQELSKKGLAQAAKFSWKKMAQQTLDVYQEVLSS